MKPLYFFLTIGLCTLSACHKKPNAEEQGQCYLKSARAALKANQITEAANFVDSLRRKVPTALNAREEAILLMDSINLADAQRATQPDSDLRVEFYRKKLEYDRNHRERH